MGRTLYTPQTIEFLVHQDEQRVKQQSVHLDGECQGKTDVITNNDVDDDTQPTLSWTIPSVVNSHHDPSKPLTWSQRSFDPDDESLPFVVERPLRPLETIEDSFLSELQGLEINYEITDRQGRYLYDIDDNLLPTGPLEPEQAVLHERRRRLDGSMVTAPPSASLPSPRLARVGVTVVVTQDDGGDSLRNDDLQGGEGQEEVDDEDDDDGGVQHGNGGYYDFPMSAGSAQQEPVILSLNTSSNSVPSHRATHGAQLTTTRPSAVVTAASNGASGTTAATTTAVPDEQDTFSPSAGIFHTHTLPFNLPDNPNALNLQRRISSSSNNHHLNQTQSLIAPQVLAHDIHGIM